ncbi:hypothetical protein E3O45_09430 [Cryobacterium sp. TMS1-20-1]|uniref:hypothetical protein n=1 Tax=Cryobacterium sp. TMS1-20-1 TaxID=1259223 RepID=UPI00106AAEF9|nr:hypothetical protein [Cryobacterium sp. TMS1-20-1]TFC75590.1 hypothetical protein E3O45_09430 [Cryobacterium sp. TMS1-20-1]
MVNDVEAIVEISLVDSPEHRNWLLVLEQMESGLDRASRTATLGRLATVTAAAAEELAAPAPSAEWKLPSAELGQIPAELVERARDVLINQQKLIGEIRQARSAIALHLAAVRTVQQGTGQSIYVDVTS